MPHAMDERIKIILLRERELDGERNPCVLEACEIALRVIDGTGITSHIEKTRPPEAE